MIYETPRTGAASTIRAAVDVVCALDTVAEYSNAATLAGRRERVYGAFERVVRMRAPIAGYGDRSRVVVSTGFATGHGVSLI